MLKITVRALEKNLDIDMYLFIEEGLTGRIFYIPKRHSEANYKYMKNYDPIKPSIYISTLIWIICMIRQWVVIFLMVTLSE